MTFNAKGFLDSARLAKEIVEYGRGETIFTQGDACDRVLYIQTGGVKLSVISKAGHEAVVAILGPGDFLGEGGLVGQAARTGSASAITPSTILFIDTDKMITLLHEQRDMSDRFIAHVLSRNIRIEEDLLDQLFNSSEKRLARALMLLAGDGERGTPERVVPTISQATLAEMVGTTRSRVNFFLNKFKRLGFIEYQRERPQGQQLALGQDLRRLMDLPIDLNLSRVGRRPCPCSRRFGRTDSPMKSSSFPPRRGVGVSLSARPIC